MNEQSVFIAALERQPAARAQFLDQACENNPGLRQRVERLITSHEAAVSFMDEPAGQLVNTVAQPPLETFGSQIGPYKLLQQIGEGGMGVVYMAEQTEPVKRRVALKIIKPGMDTRQVIARFEAERQALSLMDHPNIAKVLDAGTTAPTDGGYPDRPYFVMELVKGLPITQYCDEHHLTPRQRLELLLPVCQAIQHAHQKGIIHRDIKPTNILVAEYDQQPVPKVIDFGVAKATSQALTEKTMFTGLGQIVGTLEYMSPEQAKVNQLDIDTRSDIYSLGVLLYELLTSSTPFDRQRLRSAAFDEMLRIIREEDPPKPSTRLSDSQDSLASISAQRHTEPAKLTKLVRGELDWIVMKALEKDRNCRYETANGFAMDVQRYLADEPVQACPPSVGYRLRKFARRNKGGMAVAALVLFFLVVLGSGIGWAWRDRAARAAEQANHLERAVDRAELLQREGKRGEALAALERAQLLAREAEPAPPYSQRIESLQQLLDAEGRDAAFVARFEAIRRDVETEVDVGKSAFANGKAYPELREALEQYGIRMDVTPPAAAVTQIQKRPVAIQAVLVAALDECLGCCNPSEDAASRQWLIDVLHKADSDPWRNKVRQAWRQPKTLEALVKDMDVRQQLPSFLVNVVRELAVESPSRWDLARRVQLAYPGDFWANNQLGVDLHRAGKYEEAIRFHTAALALRPDNPGVLVNRAVALSGAGEFEAAIVDLQRAIALAPRYVVAHCNLGINLTQQKKWDDAIRCYKKAIELDPNYVNAHLRLGNVLLDQKKLDMALACYQKALELDPESAWAYNGIGNILGEQNKLDEAVGYYKKATELDPSNAVGHRNLGVFLCKQGKFDEAIAAYRNAIEREPKNANSHYRLGLALREQKKLDEAIDALHKAIELDPKSASACSALGALLCDDKRDYDGAIAAYRDAVRLAPQNAAAHCQLGCALFKKWSVNEGISEFRKAIDLDPKNAKAHYDLGNALSVQMKWDEAIRCFEKAIELDPKNAAPHVGLGNALRTQGKLDDAIATFRQAVILEKEDEATSPQVTTSQFGLADTGNERAWQLVSGDPKSRDPKRAIDFAQEATALITINPAYWRTLGAAQYRAGNWKDAALALEKSRQLNPHYRNDSVVLFFLSMAHGNLNEKEQARKLYDQAAQWRLGIDVADEELRRLCAEAADLLGLEVPQTLKEPPVLTPGPTLLKPAAGATLDNGTSDHSKLTVWEFDWSEVPGATQYHFLYVFGSGAFPFINNPTLTSSSYRHEAKTHFMNRDLLGHRWKVRALVNGTWSDWSEERTFGVVPVDDNKPASPKK